MPTQTAFSMRWRALLAVPRRAGLVALLAAQSGDLLGCNTEKAPASDVSAAEAKSNAAAQGSTAAQLQLVTPTLGGNVLAVGDHQVELAVFENGQVQGLVYTAGGQTLEPAALPKLTAALRTKGGGHAIAALAWDAPHACLQGRAALDAALVVEPIDVSLDFAGKVSTATLANYAILPFARLGGSVLAVGGYAVELVAKPDVLAAYVLDATGKAQGAGDLALQLQLGADAGSKLDLKWDPARASYVASLDAKLELMAQPLRLALTAAGKTYLGATSSLSALAATRLGARAEAGLEVPAPKLDAKLTASGKALGDAKGSIAGGAKGGAAVQVPKPSVKVSAKSASTSSKASSSGTKAKASASGKAGVSFGFGK
jgi:hypothetical protein